MFSPSTQCPQYGVVDIWEVTRAKEQLGGSSYAVNISILCSTQFWVNQMPVCQNTILLTIIVTELLNKMTNPYGAKCCCRGGVEE